MKQIPLVLALGAASLCTTAAAQSGGGSSVQLYGRVYPYLNYEKTSGATAVGTPVATLASAAAGPSALNSGIKGMSAGNSNLGVRGTEALGRGLKAMFQIEGTLAVDDGNAGGFNWNRNTFIGLEGGFGTVKLGLMDTVFKDYGDTLGILGVSSGTPMSSSNILRKPGFGTSNNARFHERRANSIRYDSPEFGPFEFGVQVSTQENIPTSATPNVAPAKTYSFGVKYDQGPLYVALAHEIHDNWFGGSSMSPSAMRNNGAGSTVESRDHATQFTVEWRIDKVHKVEFDVIRKNYKEDAVATGRFASYTNTAYLLSIDSRWNSKWRTAAHYVRSGAGTCTRVNAACSTDGLEGSKFLLGGAYYFARRTYAFAIYDQMVNGKSSRFAANDFGAVNPGEDTRHVIVGLNHSF